MTADVEALARWDADGGAPETATAPEASTVPRPRAGAGAVVRFLGLSALTVVDAASGDVAFPLGILYPYTADLRRVCAAFDRATGAVPDPSHDAALLASITTLYSRIGFALDPGVMTAAGAYHGAEKALLAGRRVQRVGREASS